MRKSEKMYRGNTHDNLFCGVRINLVICKAIEKRIRLRCKYGSKTRIIEEPQYHGLTNDLNEVVRIVEIYPGNQSGKPIEGKLFTVSKMVSLIEVAGKVFGPGPHYNPHDKIMKYIHCRL